MKPTQTNNRERMESVIGNDDEVRRKKMKSGCDINHKSEANNSDGGGCCANIPLRCLSKGKRSAKSDEVHPKDAALARLRKPNSKYF